MELAVRRQLVMIGRAWAFCRRMPADDLGHKLLVETLEQRVVRLEVLAVQTDARLLTMRRAEDVLTRAEREVRDWARSHSHQTAAVIRQSGPRRFPPNNAVLVRAARTLLLDARRLGPAKFGLAPAELVDLGTAIEQLDTVTRAVLHRRLELVSAHAELLSEIRETFQLLEALDRSFQERFSADPGRLLAWAHARRIAGTAGPDMPHAA